MSETTVMGLPQGHRTEKHPQQRTERTRLVRGGKDNVGVPVQTDIG